MSGIIDFHSHVLPGIDDGSRSVEESIAMLQAEAAQGIRHVVATPHFYPHHDSPEHFLEKRREAEEALRREMKHHPGLPELSIGAEVYFKATNVDGVYDKDPNKFDDAVKYDELTHSEVLEKGLKVMDSTASSLCRDNGIAILVFNLNDPENVLKAVKGEKIGTIVKE